MLFSLAAVDTALAPNPHPPFLIEGVVAAPTAFEVRGDGVRIGNQGKEDRLVSHLLHPIALRGVASSYTRDSGGWWPSPVTDGVLSCCQSFRGHPHLPFSVAIREDASAEWSISETPPHAQCPPPPPARGMRKIFLEWQSPVTKWACDPIVVSRRTSTSTVFRRRPKTWSDTASSQKLKGGERDCGKKRRRDSVSFYH